jgi:multiple sugar transport system substrate-binding protein
MKTKSLWLIVSLILIASMILTACGSKTTLPPAGETQIPSAAETQAPPPAGEKVKVTIFVGMGTGTDPEQIEAEKVLAAKFNATHDNIEMEFLIVPYEQSREKFQAMVSGGTAPQLVGPMGVETSGQFQDLWEDLGPYIQRDNYDTSDFYGPAIELNRTADGREIGLPVGLYPSFIYYNESAFDAAGIAYPTHDFNDKMPTATMPPRRTLTQPIS